jgi:hypothetical protein
VKSTHQKKAFALKKKQEHEEIDFYSFMYSIGHQKKLNAAKKLQWRRKSAATQFDKREIESEHNQTDVSLLCQLKRPRRGSEHTHPRQRLRPQQ